MSRFSIMNKQRGVIDYESMPWIEIRKLAIKRGVYLWGSTKKEIIEALKRG